MLEDKNVALLKYKEQTFEGSTEADPRFDSVVVIYMGSGGLGSGFFVRPDVVMTNYHVVKELKFAEMKLHNGQETFGKVMAKDVRLDLALIKVQSRGKPVEFFRENKSARQHRRGHWPPPQIRICHYKGSSQCRENVA